MPMGKAIRFDSFCIIVLILVCFPLFVDTGYTQISITDSESFGVSFTDRQTSASARGIELSVSDPLLAPDRLEKSGIAGLHLRKRNRQACFL